MWQSMFPRNFVSKVTRLLLTVPLAVAMLPMAPSFAETGSPVYLAGLTFPPGSGSAPKRTAGAGVRGNCAPGLTALIPDSAVSMTVNEDTQFFIYIPQTDALIGRFTLNFSADGSQSYTQEVLLSGQPGVVSFTMPQEIALAMDQPYDWKFTLYCDGVPGTSLGMGSSEQRVSSVSGQVQRIAISSDLEAKLKAATTPLAKAEVYANAGIWHEAMAIVSSLRESEPQEWRSLLDAVGLNSLAQAPFID
jgi:hypothetical protein